MNEFDPAENPQKILGCLKVFYYYLLNSDRDLLFGLLHPSGGQADSWSIMDDSEVLLFMNLLGDLNAIHPKHFHLEDGWKKLSRDPEKTAAKLFSKSGQEYCYGHLDNTRTAQLNMVSHMIFLFESNITSRVQLDWGWYDSAGYDGAGSNYSEFPKEFPTHWQEIAPANTQFYDWAANILKISVDGRDIATFNQANGEFLDENNQLQSFLEG